MSPREPRPFRRKDVFDYFFGEVFRDLVALFQSSCAGAVELTFPISIFQSKKRGRVRE